jgi:hypothetical protein
MMQLITMHLLKQKIYTANLQLHMKKFELYSLLCYVFSSFEWEVKTVSLEA